MTKEQLDKIYEHLSLFSSLRYIALDLKATEELNFDKKSTIPKIVETTDKFGNRVFQVG